MNGKPFFDSNILIYAHTGNEDPRSAVAQQLIESGGIIGVQQLNEFVSVAHRKLSPILEGNTIGRRPHR